MPPDTPHKDARLGPNDRDALVCFPTPDSCLLMRADRLKRFQQLLRGHAIGERG
jgi:hypothetical protein